MVIVFMGIIIFIVGLIFRRLHDDYGKYLEISVGYKLKHAMNSFI